MFGKRSQADLNAYLAESHDVSSLGYTLDTPLDVIFGSNATSGLAPEVTIGPYFVSGEYIRTDVTEDSEGVPVHLGEYCTHRDMKQFSMRCYSGLL